MKALLQRVTSAEVNVEGQVVGEIGAGLLIFLGVGKEDSEQDIEKLADKVIKLRIFEDEARKMNRSILQSEGSILVVSQFTLYADLSKGNRPSFGNSASPAIAQDYYEKFIVALKERGVCVKYGLFAADMQVELVNDGPVTIMIDTK